MHKMQISIRSMKKNILFGPIQSRRFGTSLGVDLSPSSKQCNFDCLYCELEGKKAMASMQEVVSIDTILHALKQVSLEHIDVLTITANGEPTLYPFLYDLILSIKQAIPPQVKTLILSNGSKFGDPKIQKALLLFDKVKFSFDGGNQKFFSRIDRPHRDIELKNIAQGILDFSKIYQGELFAEILFVSGINDKQENLNFLINFFQKINLKRIDISTIDRPPAYKSTPLNQETLQNIANFLQYHLRHIPIFLPKRDTKAQALTNLNKQMLLDLIKRRPLETIEAQSMLDSKSKILLEELLEEQKISVQKLNQLSFYTTKKYS